jgi:hypothetical protein
MMFDAKLGSLLSPIVKTSNYGGLPMEDLADLCVDRILSVADSAPPEIREQAKFFKDSLRKTLLDYLKRAQQSERACCIQICAQGGHQAAADILRRT